MTEPSVPQPLYSVSMEQNEPERDHPVDGGQRHEDRFDIPLPTPLGPDPLERTYERDIFGDERGGQAPKRPLRRKGEQ
jgi:hypothetical protein